MDGYWHLPLCGNEISDMEFNNIIVGIVVHSSKYVPIFNNRVT